MKLGNLDCGIAGKCSLQLPLINRRYREVKRMVAAVGNRVDTLRCCNPAA